MALTLATVVALPMLLLVGVAAHSVGDPLGLVERIALWVLGGVALTPMIAYLTVANVFIYLITVAQGAGLNSPGGKLFDKWLLYGPYVADGPA